MALAGFLAVYLSVRRLAPLLPGRLSICQTAGTTASLLLLAKEGLAVYLSVVGPWRQTGCCVAKGSSLQKLL
jgi:hypothetical protein